MPEVGPVSLAIDLERDPASYRPASGAAPLIDTVVAGGIRGNRCGIVIRAAIIVGPGILLGAIGSCVAGNVGANRANEHRLIHATPVEALLRQSGVGWQSKCRSHVLQENRGDR